MNNTPWGYAVDDELPALISVEDFRDYAGDTLSSSDEQIAATLDAVSYAIRNYCKWHVAPVLTCSWTGDADGRLIQLPAMNVSTVHSVAVNGDDIGEGYSWRDSGLIRLDKPVYDDWGRRVSIEYDAGVYADAILSVVTQLAINSLVAPPGIMREQIADASITYNQSAVGLSGGIRLHATDRALLNPFKLPGC